MLRIAAYPVLLLAPAVTLVCLIFQAVGLGADVEFEKRFTLALFAMVFFLWFLTIGLVQKLAPDLRKRLLWKGVLRGCPRWMRVGLRAFLLFVWSASVALMLLSRPAARTPAGFFLVLSGFSSLAFCVAYSFLHTEFVPSSERSS
jgi:hypothetical protein